MTFHDHPLNVRPGTAEALARVSWHRNLEASDAGELDALAFWILGDVGGWDAREALWLRLRPSCEALWFLLADDWDESDIVQDPALTEQQRYDITRDSLVTDIEQAVYVARYQAKEDARLAAYRARRAEVDARVHRLVPDGGEPA